MLFAFTKIFPLCTLCISMAVSQPSKQIYTLLPTCGPMSGATTVLIKGQGFDPTDQVHFGSSVLPGSHVEFMSSGEIMLIISGKYASESHNYTVYVVSSDGKTNSNSKYFYIYDTPNYIEEIQPKIGWEDDILTVKGRFLDCGAVKCRFGAVQMTVDASFVSKTVLKCKVPRLDKHGISSSSNVNRSRIDFKERRGPTSRDAFNDTLQNVDPPPDPDNAKKITVSSDGQHFDSIPDNIVFTYRDPVKYVAVWIWVVCILALGAIVYLLVILACCWCGFEAIKKILARCKCCERCSKRSGYSKI